MQNVYEKALLVFSILIFIFASRESWLHLRALVTWMRREQRKHELRLEKIAIVVILMVISAGPGGYYGLQLLDALAII